MTLELYFRLFYSQYDAKVGNYVHGTILGEIGNLCQSINIDIFGKNHALLNYRFKNVLIGHWSHCPCPTFLGNFCEKLGYFKVPHLVTLSVSNCLCNKLECPLLLLLLFPTQNVHLFFRQLSKPISELFSLPTH